MKLLTLSLLLLVGCTPAREIQRFCLTTDGERIELGRWDYVRSEDTVVKTNTGRTIPISRIKECWSVVR